MAENLKREVGEREGVAESESIASELHFEGFNGVDGDFKDEDRRSEKSSSDLRSNAARYKSMTPARLPITRSPCLTIPPGLSPTALLDSPVLLSNLKGEPSPTTGTFTIFPSKHDPANSRSHSLVKNGIDDKICNKETSGEFEFKPHTASCSGSNPSSLGDLASIRYPQRPTVSEDRCHAFSSSLTGVMTKVYSSSNRLTVPVPATVPLVYMPTLKTDGPAEIAPEQLWQTQGTDNGNESMRSDNIEHGGTDVVDKSSEDGYNWRKYGQKLVKGSEFPRCYYKCTHPNCQVKKQLERSHDGHITEVIYKGHHDHPKPLPGRRSSFGAVLSGHVEERCVGMSSLATADRNSKSSNDHDKSLNANSQQLHQTEENGEPFPASEDDVEGAVAQSNKICDDVEDDDPEAKRRKIDTGPMDCTQMVKAAREPRVVVQTLSEVDILDDGYRWRKYGQKVVKGNPNPRSYYKCTNAGCPVRKHVERASHDPKAVITTYEGKHNHDVPSGTTSSHDTTEPLAPNVTSNLNNHFSAAPFKNVLRTEDTKVVHWSNEDNLVSLDLGVGISLNPENMSNEQQTLYGEQADIQNETTGSNYNKLFQPTPVSVYYDSLASKETARHGTRDAVGESFSFSFKTPPLNHSVSTYEQNIGRLIMGP